MECYSSYGKGKWSIKGTNVNYPQNNETSLLTKCFLVSFIVSEYLPISQVRNSNFTQVWHLQGRLNSRYYKNLLEFKRNGAVFVFGNRGSS